MSFKLTVLIVEDKEKTITTITTELHRLEKKYDHKLKILASTDIDTALEYFSKNHIDAVFLDYELEDPIYGDIRYGDELIEELPKHIDSLFVALISGFDENKFDSLSGKINNLGFRFAYQCKPVTPFRIGQIYDDIVKFFNEKPLPYPLAQNDRAFNVAKDSEKLFKIRDSLETIVKYLTIVSILSIANDNSKSIPVKLNPYRQYTFGNWINLLKTVVDYEKNSCNYFMPEIKDVFIKPLVLSDSDDTVEVLDFLDSFLKVRNDNIGHPINTPEPASRERIVGEIEPLFHQLKGRLQFLSRYLLFVVEEIEHDKEQEKLNKAYERQNAQPSYIYTISVLMGTAIPSHIKTIYSQEILHKNNVYISNQLGNFISLYPFIDFQVSESSSGSRDFFILDSVTKKNEDGKREIVYKSYSNQKTVTLQGIKELESVFDALCSV